MSKSYRIFTMTLWFCRWFNDCKFTSKIKSTIRLLGRSSSCWKRTLWTSPSRASRTALQTHSLWQNSSRPVSLQRGRRKISSWVTMELYQRMVFYMSEHFTLWSHPCWTLYRNSLRTDLLKWFGKLRVTLSLMKASMTAWKMSYTHHTQV